MNTTRSTTHTTDSTHSTHSTHSTQATHTTHRTHTVRRLAGLAAAVVVAASACSASSETPTAASDHRATAEADTDVGTDVDPAVDGTLPAVPGPAATSPTTDSSAVDAATGVGPADSADPAPTPADPADPSDPTDPADPSDPTDPTDPADPSDPSDPGDPTDPSDPADPADPSDPADPGDPGDPADPAGPGDLVVDIVDIVDTGLIELADDPTDATIDIVIDTGLDDLVSISPCGPVEPAGTEYAVSIAVDALGDGSADDLATTFFDDEWKLRLEVAGGWTSQVDLGGQPNPWLKVVDGVRLGGATNEHIVVNEEKVGDDYSINHFFGVDADGCLTPAIIFLLEGFTGSWWHSLECDGAYTRYVRTKWHSHDAWELNVTDVRPDGTLALVENTMVGGNDPLVEGRGTNNCV